MGSGMRQMLKRRRHLGDVRTVSHAEYQGLELNARVELIRSLIPLGLMHVQMLLDEEVEALAGARYAHADGATGARHGSDPWTVVLDGQRVPIRVPRARSEQAEIPLWSDPALHGTGVTANGYQRFVGFVETVTEDEQVLAPFLRTLAERGLDLAQLGWRLFSPLPPGPGRRRRNRPEQHPREASPHQSRESTCLVHSIACPPRLS
jgi:hypothetical protein